MKLYLAGPLFTVAERQFNAKLAALLHDRGYEVWLPQDKEARPATSRNIFRKDVEGIDWADAVVACMDGPDPDSGTCWEVGYAFAKNKIIVQYRTDFRAANDGGEGEEQAPYNLMLSESAGRVLLFNALQSPLVADIRDKISDALPNLLGAPRGVGTQGAGQ